MYFAICIVIIRDIDFHQDKKWFAHSQCHPYFIVLPSSNLISDQAQNLKHIFSKFEKIVIFIKNIFLLIGTGH